MPGRVPGIHVFFGSGGKTWMAGTRPAMTPMKSDLGIRGLIKETLLKQREQIR